MRFTSVLRRRLVRLLPVLAAAAVLFAWSGVASRAESGVVQFVFTSDAHYGLTRPAFQGSINVDAHVVNAAMIAKMNTLQDVTFPKDGGLRGGERIGAIDFLAQNGDIANRQEAAEAGQIQPASVSWAQFTADYLDAFRATDANGRRAPVFMVPGNHDVSNAVGYHRPMTPLIDKAAMVGIYNHMMAPAVPKTPATYEFPRDRILTSRDIGGLHLQFVTVWPDSATRTWMEQDLAKVSDRTPVIFFTHDQPEAEPKHFTNPNGAHDINATDRFENLLVDVFSGGTSLTAATTAEQRGLERFLLQHPNVTASFHGNSNWNQFYDWTGPDHQVVLHTFRVDSPMKGAVSAKDETKLSFQVVTIDTAARTMTVRECLWNTDPQHPSAPVAWGASTTVALSPRPSPTRTTASAR